MKTYHTEKDIVLEEVLGEYLLVALQTEERKQSRTRQLNATGADIWKLLEEGKNIPDITETLYGKYEGIGKDLLEKDVTAFLEALCSSGYIKETNMEDR